MQALNCGRDFDVDTQMNFNLGNTCCLVYNFCSIAVSSIRTAQICDKIEVDFVKTTQFAGIVRDACLQL